MKKIILGMFLSLAVALPSCQEFLDINENPNYPIDATSVDLLPSGMVGTAAIAGGEMELVGSFWSQYYTQNYGSQQYDSPVGYIITTSSYQSFWRGPYVNALKNLILSRDKAKAEGRANVELMAHVMIAFNFHLLTDWYGNIPFTNVIKGAEDPNPVFEDSKTVVYPGMIKMLNDAIALKDAALKSASPAAADMVYAGDVNKWVKFAKTLKLKLLMRDFTANKAAIEALLNEGDLLTADAGLVGKFIDEYAKSNPLYESDRRGLNTNNNLSITTQLIGSLLTDSDPRVAMMCEPLGKTIGDFVGRKYGEKLNVSASRARLAATDNVYFLSEVESYFLQAEAWLRAGDLAQAKTFYDKAVLASFARANKLYKVYTGADNLNDALKTSIADYVATFTDAQLAGTPFVAAGGAYAFDATKSADELLTLVMTQKWIAAARFQAWDAYFDINRTGIPAAIFGTQGYPKRMLYPEASLNYNNNKPVVEPLTAKLWWQK